MAITAGQIDEIRSGFVLPGVAGEGRVSEESCRENRATLTGSFESLSGATVAQVAERVVLEGAQRKRLQIAIAFC